MAQAERHLVVGANGALGIALTRALLAERKRSVMAFLREPERLRGLLGDTQPFYLPGDARDLGALKQAAQGCTTLYYCVRRSASRQHWERDTLLMAQNAIEAARYAQARLVVVGSLAVFGQAPEGLLSEEGPKSPITRRGKIEALIESELGASFARGDLRYTLLRLPELYGPNVKQGVAAFAVRPLILGHSMAFPAKPSKPHEWLHVCDAARALVMVGEAPRELTEGQHFALPGPQALPPFEWFKLWAAQLSRPARLKTSPKCLLAARRLLNAELGDWLDHLYLYRAPFLLDGRRFKETFGFIPAIPYEEGIGQTLSQGSRPTPH